MCPREHVRLAAQVSQRLPRYHWIPIKIGDHAAHVADFSYVTALPADEIESTKRIATLRSSWREQVPARYTAFMGRVGTLDFKGEAVDAEVARLAKSLLGLRISRDLERSFRGIMSARFAAS